MVTPQQHSVYLLSDEHGEPVAMVKDRKVYGLEPYDDSAIARLFNGGDHLPLVPNQLTGSKSSVAPALH